MFGSAPAVLEELWSVSAYNGLWKCQNACHAWHVHPSIDTERDKVHCDLVPFSAFGAQPTFCGAHHFSGHTGHSVLLKVFQFVDTRLGERMSIDLTRNFFKLLVKFRRNDLVSFEKEHARLYAEARQQSDHSKVTAHYYSVMSTVIDEYFNGNFHFVPPKPNHRKLEDALMYLHRRIGECLKLSTGRSCVDIGCGIGGVIKDVSYTGATLTGVTIAPNEVEIGNEQLRDMGVYPRCSLVEADCHAMPFEEGSYDSAYAVYALKYFIDLRPALKEISRVLKEDGLFLVYDLMKTDHYDENNEEHRRIVEGLEYACGMPSLHSRSEMIESASLEGLELIEAVDLEKETGKPYYYCFSSNALFMWLISSKFVNYLVMAAQAARILPRGFHAFNKIFLAGTVSKIVKGGRLGILSGSEILLFRKVKKS
uniref:SAM_MT_ERG6_SMT domain-containing protein n=1 Tax=Steinernema glaseri TaxID=37863 RepID=A0A1I7YCM8_9BILA